MYNLNLLNCMAFTFLLLLMLSYWSQAAFFGQEKYKIFNNFIFLLSISSLTTLLIVRWIESGHFPLSNLYESLLFLSWCFLSLKALFEIKPLSIKKWLVTALKIEYFRGLDVSVGSFAASEAASEATLGKSKVCKPYGQSRFAKQENLKTSVIKEMSLPLEKELSLSALGLGVILSPLSLLNFGFAFLSLPKEMQQATALVPALQSNWLMMHVTVMILSYAALLSGSILSIAFLILTRLEANKSNLRVDNANISTDTFAQTDFLSLNSSEEVFQSSYEAAFVTQPFVIKQPVSSNLVVQSTAMQSGGDTSAKRSELEKSEIKNKSTLFRLTAQLDNWSYRILALGFPLLTIGILSGAVWANEAWGSYWSWDPKETWALITWLVFAIYLHTRITKGWIGQKSAIVASAGFFVVWFCYLGVNLLGTGLHSYGWFSH